LVPSFVRLGVDMKEQQAFPTTINNEILRGMTLRDYFAAAIVTGIFAHPDNVFNTHLMNATEAYQMADAMMRAREEV